MVKSPLQIPCDTFPTEKVRPKETVDVLVSGSLIIQYGKLIGAATYVLVSHPTTDCGIFIENTPFQFSEISENLIELSPKAL